MSCDSCKLYFCFNCGSQIGIHDNGYDKAMVHYEKAFCRYIDPVDKVHGQKVEQIKEQILNEVRIENNFDDEIMQAQLEFEYRHMFE